MATRSLSPTAQLLRTSRLFSLPPVLPHVSNSNNVKTESATATTPYPTRQAISTSDDALRFGDWGLKRALPRSARTSTTQPSIRILSGDTVEQVTDFQSANDHAKTLLKWQEMDIPMTRKRTRRDIVGSLIEDPSATVFNELTDNTSRRRAERLALQQQRLQQSRTGTSPGLFEIKPERWKVEGPNVVDMTEGDFQLWLQHVVSQPSFKRQFLKWLKQRVIQREINGLRSKHIADGQPGEFDEGAALQARDWEQAFQDRLRLMRGRLGPGGELNRYLEEFLDIPPRNREADPRLVNLTGATSTYTTHPSAGLSYLTNKSFMPNHPLLGPRADHEPVRARQLNVAGNAALGVGGVAATDPNPQVMSQNYDKVGGTKKWVTPLSATVSAEGRIHLKIAPSTADSAKVKEEDSEDAARRRGDLEEELAPLATTGEEWQRLHAA